MRLFPLNRDSGISFPSRTYCGEWELMLFCIIIVFLSSFIGVLCFLSSKRLDIFLFGIGFHLTSMDSDFIDRIQRISLIEEEGEIIKVRSDNRAKILEECFLSLMGRFHMMKQINTRAAKNLLQSIWKLGQDLKITEVGDGLFQFKFSIESQLNWVLKNGLWSF